MRHRRSDEQAFALQPHPAQFRHAGDVDQCVDGRLPPLLQVQEQIGTAGDKARRPRRVAQRGERIVQSSGVT
jgi:hypothetical protein